MLKSTAYITQIGYLQVYLYVLLWCHKCWMLLKYNITRNNYSSHFWLLQWLLHKIKGSVTLNQVSSSRVSPGENLFEIQIKTLYSLSFTQSCSDLTKDSIEVFCVQWPWAKFLCSMSRSFANLCLKYLFWPYFLSSWPYLPYTLLMEC